MSDLKDDREAREILKQSLLELINPDFNAATMKKIYRENRKRRIVSNLATNLFIFAVIDSLILMAVRVTGLSVFELSYRGVNLLNRVLGQAAVLKEAVSENGLVTYLVLSIGGIAALLAIIELKLNSSDRFEHR